MARQIQVGRLKSAIVDLTSKCPIFYILCCLSYLRTWWR